jgi:DNA-3-methyladenine glycosylase I
MENRCPWADSSPLMRIYHDTRWGVPVHDDHELYAMLVLEGMQAGLSWELILKREQGIRSLCDDLDPVKVSQYDAAKEASLVQNPLMIRSHAKIHAMITNARCFLEVQKEWGSFDRWIWHFTEGKTIDHHLVRQEDMPARNELSERISREMKKRGFRFTGPVIVYSYLQAVGIINDHLENCAWRKTDENKK